MVLKKIQRDKYYEYVLLVDRNPKHGRLPVHYLISRMEGAHIIDKWEYNHYLEIGEILTLPIQKDGQ